MRQIELFQNGSLIAYDCPRCGERNTLDLQHQVYDRVHGFDIGIQHGLIPEFSVYEKKIECSSCKLDLELETRPNMDKATHSENTISTDYEGEMLTPEEIQELRYAEARKRELDSRVNLFSAK